MSDQRPLCAYVYQPGPEHLFAVSGPGTEAFQGLQWKERLDAQLAANMINTSGSIPAVLLRQAVNVDQDRKRRKEPPRFRG